MPLDPSEFGGGPPATADPNYTGIWDGAPFSLQILTDHIRGSAFSVVVKPTNATVAAWIALYSGGAAATDSEKIKATLSVTNSDGTAAISFTSETPISALPLIVSTDKTMLGIAIPDGIGLSGNGGYNVTVWLQKTASGALLDQWALTGKLLINQAAAVLAP